MPLDLREGPEKDEGQITSFKNFLCAERVVHSGGGREIICISFFLSSQLFLNYENVIHTETLEE